MARFILPLRFVPAPYERRRSRRHGWRDRARTLPSSAAPAGWFGLPPDTSGSRRTPRVRSPRGR